MSETPTPDYTVERSAADGAIEIRRYGELLVAEVDARGGRSQAAGDGFRALADYIFGGNQASEKIAMTAPVLQAPSLPASAGEAPSVSATERWRVRFVMPPGYDMASLPQPRSRRVELRRLQPRRVAVLRFSGFNWESTLAEKRDRLMAWLKREGLDAAGPPTFAFYNPPWTPPFLKRNEVMVDLAD
ncbi:SOUL family heme-binding protein [Rhodothalassium salexigens]|uniref:SOUL family heme-binding protein n=1 Tax=Rhodothalassium salexigens TaxID=1086 RepID=UPI001911C8E1|nr:heme-binding protein [Rhodothalassium salexigens]